MATKVYTRCGESQGIILITTGSHYHPRSEEQGERTLTRRGGLGMVGRDKEGRASETLLSPKWKNMHVQWWRGHVTRSLVKGSRPGGSLENKHSELFAIFLPISYHGSQLAEPNSKPGLEMPFMQPKQDNLSRLRARQGSVKSACEGAKYIKMGWLNWEAAFVLYHPFSCLEHGCENGWSYRNQEKGSHLACNPSEADMETRMWVQVIGPVIQGSTGRRAGRKTGKGEKLIKDELLLWIPGAQCSWGLHCRIHFRVICPAPLPRGKGTRIFIYYCLRDTIGGWGRVINSLVLVAGPLNWWAGSNSYKKMFYFVQALV